MYSPEVILSDRENRNKIIREAALYGDVVTIKANVPGADKHIKESFLLVRHFTALALEKFKGDVSFYDGCDGFCAIIRADGENLKSTAVELEQSCSAGRFADIDVYLKGQPHSLSRGYLRKCYICGKPAFVCSREKNHTTEQLISKLKAETRAYFSIQVSKTVKESLMAELDLEDKFGLVTPLSKGSHTDLDYGIMQRAQNAVIPYLVQIFWEGFDADKTDGLLKRLRPIGLNAEKAMYEAIGTNAYKGFIFIGGLFLASLGFVISHGGGSDAVFSNIANICRGIEDEFSGKENTFGINAYREYKITGARGQAAGGLRAVKNAEKLLTDFSSTSLKTALCRIVGETDDTVLLKRSGTFERYMYFKQKISSADPTDKEGTAELTRECVKNNISIGGSADVLAAAVTLKKFRKLIYLDC